MNQTIHLTALDRELLDGLQVLTDAEISRVQAHLAAGLPMQRLHFGWHYGSAAVVGCLVGILYPMEVGVNQGARLLRLTSAFDHWTVSGTGARRLHAAELDRLAAILDMEWSRRVMATSNPVEQSHDSAIIPSLEAVAV